MTLYELAVEGLEMQATLEESCGELTPEMEARFDELMRSGPEKMLSAMHVLKTLEFEAKAQEDEKNRFEAMAKPHKDRQKSLERQAESLKKRMVIALDAAFNGDLRLPAPHGRLKVQSAKDKEIYTMAPDADIVKLSEEAPMLVKITRELNTDALEDHKKLTGSYPPEIAHKTIPGTRYLRIY